MHNLYEKFLSGSGVCTDSRNVSQGSIYFALKGASFDGNKFAEEALQKGASFAVIDNPEYQSSDRMLLVDDALVALQQLATYHRQQLKTLVVAITGSNGKTTTKELMSAVLSESFQVVATHGNLNNHIGVPLTLLAIKPETDIAIVEMGANHPGEIALLCEIAQPDYGYITSIGKAHLEGFGGLEGVMKTKSELYDYLKKHQKTIIYNADDVLQTELLSGYSNVYTFGSGQGVNVPMAYKQASVATLFFGEGAERELITSNLTGSYNNANIAAAVALGRFFKLAPQTIRRGIEKYVPANNRSQIVRKGSNTLLLDAYNANPSSMAAAIQNMVSTPDFQKKVLVLGDMFELGDYADAEHQAVVNLVEKHLWEAVFLIGENFAKTKHKYAVFPSFEAFKDVFDSSVFADCLFLIKGSRGMALERVLPLFEG
ncbi:UDP-N-acetylmuramoyl-tripeptide--D-alanyl-D-alanine ligase [Capnocytophaga sp.]|uniref:UDP-N-acetylmuramoyl-tripeptide--D-alanyl-D- alanine ligase n=1 Tax=Capnocytophaga sp. TaxID=44737 RepID=UPI0026DBB9A7|nr:UDP-N-acetylmuramoyl-tripeptide--D-alanyl-D-alanine ligase [Capnocytophaga sp.]MDO5104339.1 UDP-N-acetylmuramoyl-tripeptide--D-alanyl-D-alanine ligase [Capnocytophaga sp.]